MLIALDHIVNSNHILHFICHSLTTGMLNHFFMEEGFIQIGKHSTLAVHITVC